MRTRNEAVYAEKKRKVMETCYDCYAKNGLHGTGISALAEACDVSKATLYTYFENLDDLIVQCTEYCMSKVEDEFMAKKPKSADEVEKFLEEIPYWTAKKHGAKYRLMYQIYTHPKYAAAGKKFFEGVNKRYTEYAIQLETQIGIPHEILTPIIFTFIRACVHYAMFEDEYYLKTQVELLKQTVAMFLEKFNANK